MRRLVVGGALLLAACSGAPTSETSCESPSSQMYVIAAARWEPVYLAGEMRGLGVRQVVAGSYLACLGLRDGDVLLELDGEPIRDPRFFESFGKQREIDLLVEDAAGAQRRIVNE
jgi:hypothetical protein